MPQKANPVRSEAVLLAARLVGMHHAALEALPPPEHERGTLTNQAELVHVPAMLAFAGGALSRAETLARELVVQRERMAENVASTRGVLLAEAVALALAKRMDRRAADALVRDACAVAGKERRHLHEIIRAHEAKAAVNELPASEADALGAAELFIDAVLAEFAREQSGDLS